jgi:hypothetical protein
MKRIFAVLISGLLASAGALAQDSKMAAPAPATPAATTPSAAAPSADQTKKRHPKKKHKVATAKADAKKTDMSPASEPMAKPMAPATDTKK